MRLFPASGEINRVIRTPGRPSRAVLDKYKPLASDLDFTDGVASSSSQWRFNLRSSNTEPLVRLNVESRGNEALMREKTTQLLDLIGGDPG